MKWFSFVTVLLFVSFASHATTYYVPDDYGTIQTAIDGAQNGDTIIVRPGTYAEYINFAGKAITLRSEHGAAYTMIDGTDLYSYITGVVCETGEGPDTVLDGFTVANFEVNYGGGGLSVMNASPRITNCIFANNATYSYGGGIGVYGGGNPTISNCVFLENYALSGGGLYWGDSTGAPLTNNAFIRNTANQGAGAYLGGYQGTIEGATFSENDAWTQGGALVLDGSANVTVVNSILWNDTPDEIFLHPYYPTITVSHSDVQGGYTGTSNIDVDPLFADLTSDDYHLTWQSPCRDTGDNTAATELYDFEGDPRIALGTVDMGADEYYYHLYHVGDVVPGSPIDLKVVGYPTAPVLLALGSGIQDPPLSTQYGDLYLTLPLANKWPLGSIPGTGVLVFSTMVPLGWSPGEMRPFQALVGPLGNPSSVLTNLEVFVVE